MMGQLAFSTSDQAELPPSLWFILGCTLIIIIVIIWKFFEQLEKERKKPSLLLIDISTWTFRYMGQYEGIIRPRIEITNGNVKEFFAVQTKTPFGPRFIIPSHGKPEDLLIENDKLPTIKIMMARLLGTGAQGQQVHEQWARNAFSANTIQYKSLTKLPDYYFLVTPYWSRGMIKSAFIRSALNMASVFTFVNKYVSDYDIEIEKIWEQVSSLMSSRLQFMNDILLSQWSYISDAWNSIHKERVTPLFVLTQLLHISPTKVSYAGLSQALSHGGLESASKFISSLKGAISQIIDNLDMIAMDKTSAQLLFKKIAQQKEQLVNSMSQSMAYKEAQDRMAQDLQSMGGNGSGPNPNDAIDM